MGYSSASDIAAMCPNLLGSASAWSESTEPSRTAVNAFISSGCAIIEGKLQGWKYDVPVPSTSTLYGWLKDLNMLFASARAEMSRTVETVSPGERTRGQVLLEQFWSGLKELASQDLTLVGATRVSTAPIYVGGISQDDKDDWDDTSDRVKPRVRRGQFDFPGTIRPTISAS